MFDMKAEKMFLFLNEQIKSQTSFIALVGSHNYNLADEKSDYDFKLFVYPTFLDLYNGAKKNGHDTKVHDCDLKTTDIRKFKDCLVKSSINFIETLYSDDIFIPTTKDEELDKANKEMINFLIHNRESLAAMNIKYLIKVCRSTIQARINGFTNNGNYKAAAEAFKTAMDGVQLVYPLATPQTYQLTPHQIQTLVGQNNVWSDAGNVEVTFNLPISNLLVKRQDASDVSGDWLTLYSQPITQASDMDFTFIDFLNQHGKTYRYALVPLLTQQQGDIDVEIEGGYTVSDDVLSVFDGVFVANSNGSQKLKAATEYGDLETNQDVGVLTTIGNKYPFVVSNSNLNYHSGSISALIVPSDFYTNGDLDRLDIVERRETIEKFLTDKTAKILKDWNGNIWLITFVENVEVSFVDDYGMGLGTLSAKWVEIGDVNNQTDLKQTGLI